MTAHLRSGSLSRPITFQSRSTSQDAAGEQISTWSDIKTVYAMFEGLSAAEIAKVAALYTDVTHRITVRYDDAFLRDPKLVASYRIVYNGRYFNIKGSMNLNEEDRIVELMASEGLNEG